MNKPFFQIAFHFYLDFCFNRFIHDEKTYRTTQEKTYLRYR